jgi:hypothetical protein
MLPDYEYKLKPILGMESVQKNFAYLQANPKAIEEKMTAKPFVALHDRFRMLERGFLLKANAEEGHLSGALEVKLNFRQDTDKLE